MSYALSVVMEETARFFGDINSTLRFWREIRRTFPHEIHAQREAEAGFSIGMSASDRAMYAENPEAFR